LIHCAWVEAEFNVQTEEVPAEEQSPENTVIVLFAEIVAVKAVLLPPSKNGRPDVRVVGLIELARTVVDKSRDSRSAAQLPLGVIIYAVLFCLP
jgi:hypothetical protein